LLRTSSGTHPGSPKATGWQVQTVDYEDFVNPRL